MRIERGQHVPREPLIARIADVTGHGEAFFADDDEEEDSAVARHRPSELERVLNRAVQREVRRTLSRMTAEPAASLAKATAGSDNEGV